MHEPVGRVHFVVSEKFASAYFFQIEREKSYDYLLHEKHKFQQQTLTARAFLVHSTD